MRDARHVGEARKLSFLYLMVAQHSATEPMNPPQNTKPPRLKNAAGSPVSTT